MKTPKADKRNNQDEETTIHFQIPVMIFLKKPSTLHKNTVIAIDSEPPGCLVETVSWTNTHNVKENYWQ